MPTVTPREQKWYGWRRSLPDLRDRKYRIPPRYESFAALPQRVDLRSQCPPIMEQGAIGSCVAHAVISAMRADLIQQRRVDVALSRLQSYYDARAVEGTITSDSGCEIRTAIKCATKIGIAPETEWPYHTARFRQKPPPNVYVAAKANEALEYQAVELTMHAIKAALATGHPVIFGIAIYDSFESKVVDQTGVIPLPNAATERQHGGHAMILTGYDDIADPSRACGRNSWGTDWGNNGGFSIGWSYLTNPDLAADFWIITTVGAEKEKGGL